MFVKYIVYYIFVCLFFQRLEIFLVLWGFDDVVEFCVVDIIKLCDFVLLVKIWGMMVLFVMEMFDGQIVKESLVILWYLDEVLDGLFLWCVDLVEYVIELMLVVCEGLFMMVGYLFVMNQDFVNW